MSSKDPEKEAVPKKKEIAVSKRRGQQPGALAPYRGGGLWYDFDRMFEDFRRGFEDLLAPLWIPSPLTPALETRMPAVDIEDRGKDYLLTAELPGFKKEEVELQASEDGIEIKASAGWKYDEKTKNYICVERRCDSFYRMIELPEKIKPDEIQASLKEGLLEAVIPKKEPKEKKKIALK